jgi:hypothetical protein
MINQRMSEAEQKSIMDAAEAHIARYSAVIAQGLGVQRGIGTATCIEVNNRFFLSSAAHNFEVVDSGGDYRIFSTGKTPHGAIERIAYNYSDFGKGRLPDLAWIEIDPAAARRSGLEGLPLSSIDTNHTASDLGSYTIGWIPA